MKTEQELKEEATNSETRKHILNVVKYMNIIVTQLLLRAQNHDASKLEEPELKYFAEWTDRLATCSYGSETYKEFLRNLKPALDHHYSVNNHHPQHFKNSIEDMNIVDLVEMLIDWKSASLRTQDGDLKKSIEYNVKRFDICPQLAKILENSISILGDK